MSWIRAVPLLLLLSLASQAEEPTFPVGAGVEREVVEAWEAAVARLPGTFAETLDGVRLERASSYEMPEDAPLAYAILGRAAYASYDVLSRTVTVYDAGATGKPRWQGEAPSRAAVAELLRQLAEALGVEAADDEGPWVDAAWQALCRRVWNWVDREAPDTVPPVGDVGVLDDLLVGGVRKTLGGEVPPLEELLLHELGHAVQLQRGGLFARMLVWGTLSGWRRPDGRTTDGTWGGMNQTEDPVVLLRLLLSGERGSDYRFVPAPSARFVNPYARYDLREDFAECVRLAGYHPEELAARAPEKLLYVNTLDLCTSLAEESVTWRDLDELPREQLTEGFRRLLSERDSEPACHPVAVVAILRAHADLLAELEVAPPAPLSELPPDLPSAVRAVVDPEFLRVEIGDLTYHPPGRSVLMLLEDVFEDTWSHRAFSRGIDRMLSPDADELRDERMPQIEEATELEERAWEVQGFCRLARGVLPQAELDALVAREVARLAGAKRPLLAAMVALEGSAAPLEDRLAAARVVLGRSAEASYDATELATAIAHHQAESGDVKGAAATLLEIRGDAWGAFSAVRRLIELTHREEFPEDLNLLAPTADLGRRFVLPGLRPQLQRQIGRALGGPEDRDPPEER